MVCDLTGLACEAERGIGKPRLTRVLRGAARELLVLAQFDRAIVRAGAAEKLHAGGVSGARVGRLLELVVELLELVGVDTDRGRDQPVGEPRILR